MNYELAWEPRGVALSFFGQITFDDIRDATVHYQGDFRFDLIRYVIADFSRITGCEAAPAEMDYLWAIDRAAGISNPRIRKAIISTCPNVIALAMHYKDQEVRACPTEIFPSLGDARRWLAVEEHA